MKTPMRIDFVSDVSCPWCVIGLHSLERALERVTDKLDVELHFQPFELNPQMPAGGQDIHEHLTQKYGGSREQFQRNGETIRARGAELGFTFDMDKRNRIYNTFDAHRLLHWAEEQGKQRALKHALFEAYFTEGKNPGAHSVLIDAATRVGLDPVRARAILESDTFSTEVRQREQFFQEHGIHAVPSVIFNSRHLVQGGQPVEVFEQALRQIAAESAGSSEQTT